MFLHNSRPLRPPDGVSDAQLPVLCLTDALVEDGFQPVRHITRHSVIAPLEFDERKARSKGLYFQCLRAREKLWHKGAPEFHSQHTQAFYSLLLRAPSKAKVDMTAKQCDATLQGLEPGGNLSTESLVAESQRKQRRRNLM